MRTSVARWAFRIVGSCAQRMSLRLRRSVGDLPAQIGDITRHKDRRTLDEYSQAGKVAEHVPRVV